MCTLKLIHTMLKNQFYHLLSQNIIFISMRLAELPSIEDPLNVSTVPLPNPDTNASRLIGNINSTLLNAFCVSGAIETKILVSLQPVFRLFTGQLGRLTCKSVIRQYHFIMCCATGSKYWALQSLERHLSQTLQKLFPAIQGSRGRRGIPIPFTKSQNKLFHCILNVLPNSEPSE